MLVFAIAVNFEPFRLWLVPILLMRPRPVAQLLAFLASSVITSTAVGLLVLFVLQDGRLGLRNIDAGIAKIVIGLLALLVAAWLGLRLPSRWSIGRGSGAQPTARDDRDGVLAEATAPRATNRITARARTLAMHGSSPWISGAVGLAAASIPSVDYLALLVLIAASATTPAIQVAALITFVFLANLVVAIPIFSSLIAPRWTQSVFERFHAWVLSRSRRDVAAFVAIAGVLLIAAGVQSL